MPLHYTVNIALKEKTKKSRSQNFQKKNSRRCGARCRAVEWRDRSCERPCGAECSRRPSAAPAGSASRRGVPPFSASAVGICHPDASKSLPNCPFTLLFSVFRDLKIEIWKWRSRLRVSEQWIYKIAEVDFGVVVLMPMLGLVQLDDFEYRRFNEFKTIILIKYLDYLFWW